MSLPQPRDEVGDLCKAEDVVDLRHGRRHDGIWACFQACSHCPAEDKNKLIISFIWIFYIIFESKYPFTVNKDIFVSNHHTTKSKSWGSWGLSFLLTRLAIFTMLIGLGILAGGAFTSVAARISSTMRGADLVKICCTAFTLTWKELHISHWIYQILIVFNLVVVFMENLV